MNADAELNPRVLRHAGVALDHSGLDFDREAHGVDHSPPALRFAPLASGPKRTRERAPTAGAARASMR
jgi:hypothetical protein